MKKFTRSILPVFLLVFASNLQAQFGVQVGYIYSPSNGNLTLGTSDEFSGTTRNNGFQAGLTYDFKIKGEWGMQAGLLYSYAGGKTREMQRSIGQIYGTQLTTSSYQFIDLPIRASYSLPVTNDFKFFFFAGPVFSYGLSSKSSSQIAGVRVFNKYDIYSDFKDEISPFNLKAGGGLGVLYNDFRFSLGYDQGILNLYNGEKRKNLNGAVNKLKRNQFSVSLAYVF